MKSGVHWIAGCFARESSKLVVGARWGSVSLLHHGFEGGVGKLGSSDVLNMDAVDSMSLSLLSSSITMDSPKLPPARVLQVDIGLGRMPPTLDAESIPPGIRVAVQILYEFSISMERCSMTQKAWSTSSIDDKLLLSSSSSSSKVKLGSWLWILSIFERYMPLLSSKVYVDR